MVHWTTTRLCPNYMAQARPVARPVARRAAGISCVIVFDRGERRRLILLRPLSLQLTRPRRHRQGKKVGHKQEGQFGWKRPRHVHRLMRDFLRGRFRPHYDVMCTPPFILPPCFHANARPDLEGPRVTQMRQ